ncbi:MAG: transcriptional regulator [Magnetococcales bacterium]|nr:transcriptional regulator [Magnetococcales bacterium]MEC8067545.1 helix-turn-helix domain-containing protein [Pseudomonadota bacterium]|tara:strand:+ start:11425 stop:11808 length:384 start_codon:yes stop_codon:yes gene_type:complete
MSGPDPVDVHVGSRVRLRRTVLGMSQERLADQLGITFQQVQKYENGSNRIGASRLYMIATILNVSVEYFYEGYKSDALEVNEEVSEFDRQLNKRESIDLIRAYYSIADDKVRKKVLDLVKSMAKTAA